MNLYFSMNGNELNLSPPTVVLIDVIGTIPIETASFIINTNLLSLQQHALHVNANRGQRELRKVNLTLLPLSPVEFQGCRVD